VSKIPKLIINMATLFGTFEGISIDDKGRISIPAILRKAVAEKAENTFIIIRGVEGCLFAFPKDQWLVFWNELQKLPMDRENTLLIHRILGTLKEAVLDGQGRIALTHKLKSLAGIGKVVTIVGEGDKLLVWDPERWTSHLDGTEATPYDTTLYRAMEKIRKTDNG